MPFGDGTGPQGQGPQTGRGLGYCSGSNTPGHTKLGFRRGYGRARGGFRNCFHSTSFFGRQRVPKNTPSWDEPQNSEQEKQALASQLQSLKNQAQKIEQRLQDLEGSK